jgi:hypothetical protein
MECDRAQAAILESLADPPSGDEQAEIEAHLAGCQSCAAFARAQRDLDRQLSVRLSPPPLRVGFRAAVRERARHEARTFWPDLLPDALHFAGCGVGTVLALIWLPLSAPVVLACAAAGTLLTHVVLTAAHESLDAAEDFPL